MANTRALATAGLLLTLASGTSIATSPQDMAAQAKSCKALSDDKQRLKCFDHLFGDTPKLEKSEVGRPANWSIEETKSPDGSPQVVAANLVNDVRSGYLLRNVTFSLCTSGDVRDILGSFRREVIATS
jgi:hypothetical protein